MSTREDRLGLAGEYVLGTLDEAERKALEREMATDGELSAIVQRFAGHLSSLDEAAGDAAVPVGMWEAVETRIANLAQQPDTPTPSDPHAAADAKVVQINRTRSRSPSPWRATALAASFLAAIGMGYFVGNFVGGHRQPKVIVLLQTPANTTGAIFEAYADNSVRIVPLENFEVPAGRILQVWTLYDDAVGPVSLGTLDAARPALLRGQPWPEPTVQQLYEITLEPAPGSPTGKPTGPILVKGFAQKSAGS